MDGWDATSQAWRTGRPYLILRTASFRTFVEAAALVRCSGPRTRLSQCCLDNSIAVRSTLQLRGLSLLPPKEVSPERGRRHQAKNNRAKDFGEEILRTKVQEGAK